jgi:hypothetical protein
MFLATPTESAFFVQSDFLTGRSICELKAGATASLD